MTPKTYLIAGATGDTGRPTVALLLERGHRVRALVHRADARANALARQGAEVAVGDLLDFGAVRRAMTGVDGAYFCYPVAAGLIQATAFFAQAARDARIGAVVNMSQIVARPDAVSHASVNHWVAERVLDWSGLAVTHLRPTMFAEWLVYTAPHTAATGTLSLPFEGGRVALVAAADQARVIAAVLEDPVTHRGRTYELFGPTELTYPEIAGEMSKALGREIQYAPLELNAFAEFLRASGRAETDVRFLVQHGSGMVGDFRAGRFAGTNDIVRRVGGREPTGVREFVAARAAAFTRAEG